MFYHLLEMPRVSFYHFLVGKKNPADIVRYGRGNLIGFLYYLLALIRLEEADIAESDLPAGREHVAELPTCPPA